MVLFRVSGFVEGYTAAKLWVIKVGRCLTCNSIPPAGGLQQGAAGKALLLHCAVPAGD